MKRTILNQLNAVAGNIKSMRLHRNYTQEYIAYKLGISQNAYSKIELNYTRITVDRLFHIAEILEVDFSTLVGHQKVA
ncbi:hypothetical protein GCM10023149_02510 [Mucilaginibacter gynuensis]|uniref:HTH cro/C1-type domain-containing protein n=1 Tax=Mucilaginibacter gynuensis TaxID=1302236 RepID=A0ABP8FQ83_9SPHI